MKIVVLIVRLLLGPVFFVFGQCFSGIFTAKASSVS